MNLTPPPFGARISEALSQVPGLTAPTAFTILLAAAPTDTSDPGRTVAQIAAGIDVDAEDTAGHFVNAMADLGMLRLVVEPSQSSPSPSSPSSQSPQPSSQQHGDSAGDEAYLYRTAPAREWLDRADTVQLLAWIQEQGLVPDDMRETLRLLDIPWGLPPLPAATHAILTNSPSPFDPVHARASWGALLERLRPIGAQKVAELIGTDGSHTPAQLIERYVAAGILREVRLPDESRPYYAAGRPPLATPADHAAFQTWLEQGHVRQEFSHVAQVNLGLVELDPALVALPNSPDDEFAPWAVDPDADLDHEYAWLAGPKLTKEQEQHPDGSTRINPLFYKLSDFPLTMLERHGASWVYVVDAAGEIYIGTEKVRTVLTEREWDSWFRTMHPGHVRLTAPQYEAELEAFKKSQDGQGHTTIGIGFENGRPVTRMARVAGELNWDATSGQWQVNDMSGRFMSDTVRPNLDAADTTRWVKNVAGRMSIRFGRPVDWAVIKSAPENVKRKKAQKVGKVGKAERAADQAGAVETTVAVVAETTAVPAVVEQLVPEPEPQLAPEPVFMPAPEPAPGPVPMPEHESAPGPVSVFVSAPEPAPVSSPAPVSVPVPASTALAVPVPAPPRPRPPMRARETAASNLPTPNNLSLTLNLDVAPLADSRPGVAISATPIATPAPTPEPSNARVHAFAGAPASAPTESASAPTPSPSRVPRSWRLSVTPDTTPYTYDLEQIAAELGHTEQLTQLRQDHAARQPLTELGDALAEHVRAQIGAAAPNHVTVTLQAKTEDLAFPGLSLAHVVANKVDGVRAQLTVPWQAEPLGVCRQDSAGH
jgi:hypothetical protein